MGHEDVPKKKVHFEFHAEPGHEVFIAGTFNNWKPHNTKLQEADSDGDYETTLLLPKGKHEYKFVVDGQWRADPECSEWVPNGHGSLNSVVTVR